MKKAVKFIVYAILAVVALALLLVLTLPLWLGTIARPVINAAVPKVTQTDFNIAHLHLNPYTGRFELGGFVLGNPDGYDERTAVSLGNLVFDVAMTTLGGKYVHIEEVTVEDLFVSYVDGGEHDVDNFTQIQYNVAGGKEKYEESKRKAELAKSEKPEKADEPEDEAGDAEGKKFVIDRLTIKGVRLKYGKVTIKIPVDIVLTDLGKESDGVTFSQLVQEIWVAILKAASSIGDGVKAIGSIVGDAVKSIDVPAIGDSATKAVDSAGEGVKKTADAVKKLLNF